MFWRHNLIALFWAIIIAVLILMPGENIPNTGDLLAVDKLAHFFVYAVLSFLFIVGFSKQQSYDRLRNNAIIYAFVGCILYSTTLEVIQSNIPDREFDLLDMLANTVGIGGGVLFFYFLYRI